VQGGTQMLPGMEKTPAMENPPPGCQGAEREELTAGKAGGATLEQRGGKQNMPSSPRG